MIRTWWKLTATVSTSEWATAAVWSYPEYVPGQRRVISTDIAVLYVGNEAEKQALLLSEPYLSRPHARVVLRQAARRPRRYHRRRVGWCLLREP
jgi:hypothetical protein